MREGRINECAALLPRRGRRWPSRQRGSDAAHDTFSRVAGEGRRALFIAAFLALAPTAALADIKIGFTISGSGPGAALGQPELKSMAIMPKEVAGEKITYVVLDDGTDPTRAAQNARKLIDEDKVDVLIGSSVTPSSLPLIGIAAETKTPLISIAASKTIIAPVDDKRRWVFKVVPNDDILAAAILDHMAKAGVKKLGYIGFSDAYGEGYYRELSKAAPALGITLTTHEVYARADTSVTGQALKVIASRPDAVFIAAAGTPAVLPQKALRERGFTGPIYQTHGVAMNEFIKFGGKAVDGVVFAGEGFSVSADLPDGNPFKAASQSFIKSYQAQFGAPPSMFSAHPVDAVSLVVRAAPAALKVAKPGTPEFRAALRDEIEKTKDLYLNNGLMNLSPTNHGGYDKRSAFIVKIENGAFRWVKP